MVKFSIIIPVAPDRNAEVVDSLKNLDYRNYEIIIEKGKNPSLNRNNGAKKAKGEILLFLDDDAYVDKELLKKGEEFFKKYPSVNIAGGIQLTPSNDKWFAKTSGYAIASFFGTQEMSRRYKKGKLNFDGWNFITSALSFVKKKSFDEIGGFNEKLFPGEDPEFYLRAKKKGMKIAYCPDLIIYHKRRNNLKGFFKQFYLYGKVRRKTGKVGLIFLLPSFFVIYLLLTPFFRRLFLIPLFAYILAAISFSIYDSIKNKDILAIPFLPFFYFIIHFSYGLGVLRSLFE